ncbi:putative serine/threonine-protein kinase [Salvia hispanica]|uniref:putative serine/threonine-protein kinase n=1 Tax=Salvia hispanica TaxID=49212 RepID=UPI0020094929|nr:putative serine/threonine-protein kinase [Salvia hispanica]XP_047946809.1 putative serine/threonine-protein kinase [Salvia hispanica]XP_047946810.1 putative serine/threonine-protein kinase [Salvia hispanica]
MSCGCFGASSLLRKSSESSDKNVHNSKQDQEAIIVTRTRTFSFDELRVATNNFNMSNKIGRGGFGIVYKGILKNGMVVAVKMLSAESKQGEREFLTEIETISNVKHPNLVQLLGCCVHGRDQILVYEYLVNNSIDRALLGPTRSVKLDWGRRSAICLGTARGLEFLHEQLVPRIVHRDIKGSNILLDADFQPKIGDFGLAKLFPDNISHITTKIAGTTGYLAPEYALGGRLTVKADVYSYGILTLEVVSGRTWENADHGGAQKLLAEWAWELYQEAKLLDLVDPELEEFPEKEVLRYVKVALFCTQAAASRRPLMSQVIEMLSRNVRLNVNELTPPGFFDDSASLNGGSAKVKLSGASTSYQMNSFASTITQVTPR